LIGMYMQRPEWLEKDKRNAMRSGMLALGGLMFLAGAVWGRWFPINKNLWTSSYVLVAAGIATIALAVLNWLVDGRSEPWPGWLRVTTWPWFVFGSNAIAAFTISVVFVKALLFFKITGADGTARSLWGLVYTDVFARHGSNEWTSLAFAVSFVVVCFLPVWLLWRKRIFLRM